MTRVTPFRTQESDSKGTGTASELIIRLEGVSTYGFAVSRAPALLVPRLRRMIAPKPHHNASEM